jgi:hypothetical protein
MRDHPSVAMVFGGMAQLYPTPIALPNPNQAYLSYEYVQDRRDITFARGVYPDGLLPSETFLRLFAEDPANRNNVTGATMFRAASLRKANALAHGREVKWQSGYLMLAGTATVGDVWYIDEPCVVATVELDSASYRGSQLQHMLDCMRSIDAAFHTVLTNGDGAFRRRMARLRARMIHSTFQTYLGNKISYRLGWFKDNPLEGIEKIFRPEITRGQFLSALATHGVRPSDENKLAVLLSSLPSPLLRTIQYWLVNKHGFSNTWWKELTRFPSTDEAQADA